MSHPSSKEIETALTLTAEEKKLAAAEQKLATAEQKLATAEQKLATAKTELITAEQKLATAKTELATAKTELIAAEQKLITSEQSHNQFLIQSAQSQLQTATQGEKTAQDGVTTAQDVVTTAQKAVNRAEELVTFWTKEAVLLYSAVAKSKPIFSNNDYWHSCGIVETMKAGDTSWCQEGQCVVVHQNLVLTAAHVCFHRPDANSKKTSSLSPPPPYVPYPHIRAVFKSRSGETLRRYDCVVLRYSDSMDVAILHIKSNSDSESEPFLIPLPIFMDPLTLRADVIMFGLYNNSPCEAEGHVIQIRPLRRKTIPKESFKLAHATYAKRNGLSGAAILHYDGGWKLVGIHRGADFVRFDETTPQLLNYERATKRMKVTIEASKSAPPSPADSKSSYRSSSSSNSSPYNTRSSARQTSSSSKIDSYNPSDSSTPDLKQEESGHANVHSHTNDSWSSFAIVESVLQCDEWSIDSCLARIASSDLRGIGSPPTSKVGHSGRVELQEIDNQLFDINEAEEEVDR